MTKLMKDYYCQSNNMRQMIDSGNMITSKNNKNSIGTNVIKTNHQ